MEVIHIQPILHLLLIGGGGEGSIWVKSRSCSKAVPTLQHTIYGKQNKRSRKIGFEHYQPKRIIVNTSCSVQGLPWAPSAFKAEKGNIKLEQQPGFTVCFLTCLVRWGSLYLWQNTREGTAQALFLLCTWHCHCEPELGQGANTALPRQGCPLPQHPQPAPSWDGSAFLMPQQLALAILAEAHAAGGSEVGQEQAPAQDRLPAGAGAAVQWWHRTTAQTNRDAGTSSPLGHHCQNSPRPCPGDPGLGATRAREQQRLRQGRPFPPFPPRSRPHPPGALSQIPRQRRLPADRTV